MRRIEVTVNGTLHHPDVDEKLTLLRYLRKTLHLYGAKNGCERGQCGTCTVIVDGAAKRSCVLKMDKLDGARVETIEGLAVDGKLHPLQTAFVKKGAIQCGFCTPGMILAAKALLDADPDPTPADIKKALRHNLCRCTGYVTILEAVELAAAVLRGERSFEEDPQGGVGVSVVRKDAVAKAMGSPLYADDLTLPGVLHGKILYSEHPYADIVAIDTSAAEKAPGVVRVATANDIPGRKTFGLLNPNQQIMAEKRVLYVGDSVAVVFAETEAQAAAARDLIRVEYKPLKGIYSIDDALKDDAPVFHDKGKVISHTKVRRGDVERGFAESEVVVEGEYSVPMVEHAYLEPESALCSVDGEGHLTLWSGNQGSHAFQDMIAKALALPVEKVRVIATPAGGGFGGKEEPTVQIHCALGAHLTGRPVKITMTREESLRVSTKRHAEELHYKLGAKKDGTLVAFEADVKADTGAYDSLGMPVVFRSGVVTAGPYTIPYARTDSRGYYTNHPPGGAFRGFGSTQVAFAAEVQMDVLARKLGMDPFDLRLKNALAEGKQTITGQTLGKSVGLKKTLEAVRGAMEQEKKRTPSAGKKLGFGVACSYKNVGIGSGKSDKAGAELELLANGRLLLKTGAAEIGQGPGTIMAQIAAEATGIPYERFDVLCNDTELAPDGEETTASRQTFISGNAVVAASKRFMEKLRAEIGRRYSIAPDNAAFCEEGVADPATGALISWGKVGADLSPEELGDLVVREVYVAPRTCALPENNLPQASDGPDSFDIHFVYCFGTHGVVVEVDESTGEVQVLKVIAAHDCGKMINPLLFRGQVQGGVMMGLGYGLSEEFALKDGRVVTDTLGKLGVPKITDTPEIEVIPIEEGSPGGPFGAKGMGELPVNPVAPAIVNAIYDAVGVRITSLPVTREKVLAALREKKAGGR